MYYSTTNEKGKQLDCFHNTSERQELKVLRLCKEKQQFTCSGILTHFKNTPKSSIHRAINTLEKDGLISKTKTKRIGMYGRPETLYVSLEV